MTIGTLTRRSSAQVTDEHTLHAGSGPHDGERCACRHDGTYWRQMCVAAAKAWDEEHKAAQVRVAE
jgi:hypothetical protein